MASGRSEGEFWDLIEGEDLSEGGTWGGEWVEKGGEGVNGGVDGNGEDFGGEMGVDEVNEGFEVF